MNAAPNDPKITVSLPRSEWQALLNVVPMAAMTYTAEGIAIFNAYQAIFHALNPAQVSEGE